MDLYNALHGILSKINEGATEGKYQQSEKDMLRTILENQSRLAEGILIVGGLLKAILVDDLEVEVMAGKDEIKH